MKFKRTLAVVLALGIVLGAAGCGKKETSSRVERPFTGTFQNAQKTLRVKMP